MTVEMVGTKEKSLPAERVKKLKEELLQLAVEMDLDLSFKK